MKLIEEIVSDENLNAALKRVKSNKGAAGIDNVPVKELDEYFKVHKDEIVKAVLEMKYKPQPVRRVYIPKPNGKKRPLGIPTVMDRVIQQAIAQKLVAIYDHTFSDFNNGYRPDRNAQTAVTEALNIMNEGYEWIIDLDIEKYFDTVNHDKLISILRERVQDKATLHLIRSFLRAGVMENGLTSPTEVGVPQGGPLSPILSNIYLDKFDKELESRGLNFVRFADDCVIMVKSEMAANRVMKSVSSWLERKLFLKVSATKTKVVRPKDGKFLGFTFWKSSEGWKCRPLDDRKARLYTKIKECLIRKRAAALPLAVTFTKVNQIVRGWINYYSIGSMKTFLKEFGEWLRHKIRVVIIKQWKGINTVSRNLMFLNRKFKCHFTDEDIFMVANTRLGIYRKCGMIVVNYLLSPSILAMKNKDRPGLVDPLKYYLSKSCLQYKRSAVIRQAYVRCDERDDK